jgi:mannose-6-phosphate isomerase-like protein (cupin superfamily)
MTLTESLVLSVLAITLACGSATPADADENIAVKRIDDIIRAKPLSGGATAAIVESMRAGGAEVGVLVMSKNRLHHHSHQDHVLYVVRGRGTAKLENATGQVETRMIEPGDILSLPRGKKHGFEKSGNEDLVFLVVATPLPPGVEETTYHE